jgi:hypothetical protein
MTSPDPLQVIRETLLLFSADAIARHAGTRGEYGKREAALAALDQVGALVKAAGLALVDLDGVEVPFVDQHRPLQALDAALQPFSTDQPEPE